MRITIFGANGHTGRLLTRQALDEGHDVTAFTRHPDVFPIEHSSLPIAAGDVQDADAACHRSSSTLLRLISGHRWDMTTDMAVTWRASPGCGRRRWGA